MNPHMIGYNISCLPDNALHQKRRTLHDQQLDEWVIHTDIPLVVVAMGYRPDDYRHDLGGRVRYIPLDQPVPVAEARNICLQDFYSSGYRWAAMMDNDATLYHSPTHNSGYGFVAEMTAQIDHYDEIGLFYPINPMQTPYRSRWEDTGYFTNHVFERGFATKGTLVFVRNFPQFGQPPIYQDTSFTFMEDNAFGLAVLAAEHAVFQNWNMVLKELVPAGGLSFFGDAASRPARSLVVNRQMAAKFQHLGLGLRKGGGLDTRAMVNRCWPKNLRSMLVVNKPCPSKEVA